LASQPDTACPSSEILGQEAAQFKGESGAFGLILGCVSFVKQASVLEGFAFDPFSFQQDGLTSPEVDIGRRQSVDALLVAQV
jgi:hypothetical protein